jgi:hypothetical protein
VDVSVVLYILIAGMVASGGVLGAFWVRALTIMRRRMVDSGAELTRLAEAVARQDERLDDALERLERAERLLGSGQDPRPADGDTPPG